MVNENLKWCIDYLKEYNKIDLDYENNEKTLRALMNITMPINLSDEFYEKEQLYLKERLKNIDIIDVSTLNEVREKISLYKGDITHLKADAIVNASNEKLLGCFIPLHNCIDNAIHSFGGLEIRRDL